MPRHIRTQPALLAAAITCLLPLLALAAQQTPPQTPQPPDAKTQEASLGLTGPANPKLPSLILVGDSTVRNGHGTGSDGLWGWGAPIADLFDPTKINVVNRAIGGLSSHTYISQGHWASTLELIKPGDFVLIQFGHNDGGLNLPGADPVPDQGLQPGAPPPTTTPAAPNGRGSLPGIGDETIDVPNPRANTTETVHTFGWYMRKYVDDTRAKGATPILCSLVPRKIWLPDGHIHRSATTYERLDPASRRRRKSRLRRPQRDHRPPLRRPRPARRRTPLRRPPHPHHPRRRPAQRRVRRRRPPRPTPRPPQKIPLPQRPRHPPLQSLTENPTVVMNPQPWSS